MSSSLSFGSLTNLQYFDFLPAHNRFDEQGVFLSHFKSTVSISSASLLFAFPIPYAGNLFDRNNLLHMLQRLVATSALICELSNALQHERYFKIICRAFPDISKLFVSNRLISSSKSYYIPVKECSSCSVDIPVYTIML